MKTISLLDGNIICLDHKDSMPFKFQIFELYCVMASKCDILTLFQCSPDLGHINIFVTKEE